MLFRLDEGVRGVQPSDVQWPADLPPLLRPPGAITTLGASSTSYSFPFPTTAAARLHFALAPAPALAAAPLRLALAAVVRLALSHGNADLATPVSWLAASGEASSTERE